LLAVLAHPDDEAFRCGGTLSMLARRGVSVSLMTATRGGAGSCGAPPLCRPEQLPAVREQELRCACKALGIEAPLLLDYEDGGLAAVDEEEGVQQVLAAIRKLRPGVLLTWPPDGLSGHSDHMAVSRWTSGACERTRDLGSAAPASLYYLAVPCSLAQALGLTQLKAIPDHQVSVSVDVSEVWEQKLDAIRCHRTQAGESPILSGAEERQRLFLGREHFVRAGALAAQYDFLPDVGEQA
jgi:LmbE family N-acetylglucosaminyl deacetylase